MYFVLPYPDSNRNPDTVIVSTALEAFLLFVFPKVTTFLLQWTCITTQFSPKYSQLGPFLAFSIIVFSAIQISCYTHGVINVLANIELLIDLMMLCSTLES